MTENKLPAKPYPLGAHCENGGIRFSFVSGKEDCGVMIYDRITGKRLKKLSFTKDEKIGKLYCKFVADLDAAKVSYHFYEGDKIIVDERARAFADSPIYGKVRSAADMKAVFPVADFDWDNDCNPQIPYENCVAYCMHVRGFTRHASSGVTHKGTFLGVTEKLDYLKKTGITTVELQPAYEFLEMPAVDEEQVKVSNVAEECKINYLMNHLQQDLIH